MTECNRDGCTNDIGRFDTGGGLYYCSQSCENKSLEATARLLNSSKD